MTDTLPRPGDYACVTTRSSQWRYRFAAWLIRFGCDSSVNHSVVFVGDVPGFDKPQVVEARPGGAGLADWDSYEKTYWSTGRLPADLTPTPDQLEAITRAAIGYIGTPYSLLDIIAIALAQRRAGRVVKLVPLDQQPWPIRRLASRRRMICSQLVDQCYRDAGINLFQDGRPAGLVSPGDLLLLFQPETANV